MRRPQWRREPAAHETVDVKGMAVEEATGETEGDLTWSLVSNPGIVEDKMERFVLAEVMGIPD